MRALEIENFSKIINLHYTFSLNRIKIFLLRSQKAQLTFPKVAIMLSLFHIVLSQR